jgi:hypothetical protein
VAIGKVQKPCCGKAMDNPLETLPANALNKLYQSVNVCCSTYMIELSTDNFQLPVQLSCIDFQQVFFDPALFLENFLSQSHSGISFFSSYFFPPGGLARYSIDLLTVICIFRI